MFIELYALTDVGRVRQGNEDNFLLMDLSAGVSWTGTDDASIPENLKRLTSLKGGLGGLVLAVSDGMGGEQAGDVASQMAVEGVRQTLSGNNHQGEAKLFEELVKATLLVNNAVYEKSICDTECSGMGATFTGTAISEKSIELLQIGDSRAYLMRDGNLTLITKDQSLVQQLVETGQITAEEAVHHPHRNLILQALGAQREVSPTLARLEVRQNDLLLLCSDGLSGKLNSQEMGSIISDTTDLQETAEALVKEANERGGEDNITVVLARFGGEDLTAPESSEIHVKEFSLSTRSVPPGWWHGRPARVPHHGQDGTPTAMRRRGPRHAHATPRATAGG
ncbi:MAG: protein phosphatase 2C domain-containing protein [Pyrinomonadaceae bacterium]